MADVKETIKKYGAYIELGAYLLALIGCLLPFIEASMWGISVSYSFLKLTKWGVLVLILIIIAAVVVIMDTFARNVIDNYKDKNQAKASLIDTNVDLIPLSCTAVSFIITLITTMRCKSMLRKLDKEIGDIASLASGVYLLLVALIVALAIRAYALFAIKKIKVFENKKNTNEPTAAAANVV